MIRKVLSVAALASMTAFAANAQAPVSAVKPITFGIKAGSSFLTSDAHTGLKSGYILGAQVGLATPGLPVSFRVDADFNRYSARLGDAKAQMWGFTGNALYDLPTAGLPVSPYAIAGLGMFTTKVAGVKAENNFGYNVGGGIKLPLSGFNTFLEARYTNVSTKGKHTQSVPLYFGISF